MPDKFRQNILNIDILGVAVLIMAGLITYGSRFIAEKILKVPPQNMFKVTTVLKIIGIAIGLFGLYRVTS
ncbi:MAG: hypothetical protein GX352_06315 [Clostridiales bacterium]|nr:hypothetical protein [Clostridiales bacterium]